jgi:hypothetical protein
MTETAIADRRARRRTTLPHQAEVRLRIDEPGGPGRLVITSALDYSGEGLGLVAAESLPPGLEVALEPSREFTNRSGHLPARARVAWCRQTGPGQFRLGLHLLIPPGETEDSVETPPSDSVIYPMGLSDSDPHNRSMPVSSPPDRRTRPRSRTAQASEIRLRIGKAGRDERIVPASVLDHTDRGLGLLVMEELPAGIVADIEVSREFRAKSGTLPPQATIIACEPTGTGRYRLSLRFHLEEPPPTPPATPPVEEAPADYYELLQIHPKAHPDTIHRVYRLLAQRYHPDNLETGNAEIFHALTTAQHVLLDPERRAAYDLQHRDLHRKRFTISAGSNDAGASSTAAERRKRHLLLAALYHRRLLEPTSPAMTIFDLEDCLGVAREHLEFTLWYLKERSFVARSDNNRFHITVAGVDEHERLEAASPATDYPRLPAPA